MFGEFYFRLFLLSFVGCYGYICCTSRIWFVIVPLLLQQRLFNRNRNAARKKEEERKNKFIPIRDECKSSFFLPIFFSLGQFIFGRQLLDMFTIRR